MKTILIVIILGTIMNFISCVFSSVGTSYFQVLVIYNDVSSKEIVDNAAFKTDNN